MAALRFLRHGLLPMGWGALSRLTLASVLCFVGVLNAAASETTTENSAEEAGPGRSASYYDKLVRDAVEKTAAEAKARKDQERLDKAAKSGGTLAGTGESFRVFKYRKDGATVFSDQVPYKIKYEVIVYNSCYACSLDSKVDWNNTRLHMSEFADTISSVSNSYNVDPALVRAIIHAESAFNPLARSNKGASGLMQLMPGTAKDMGVKDASNPEQNIKGGVKYLANLLQTFNGNIHLAAAAYNAGPGAVTKYGGIPPFAETQTYVKRVGILFTRYKSQLSLASN